MGDFLKFIWDTSVNLLSSFSTIWDLVFEPLEIDMGPIELWLEESFNVNITLNDIVFSMSLFEFVLGPGIFILLSVFLIKMLWDALPIV